MQLVVNATDMDILCLAFCEGKKHDLRLFKDSGVCLPADTEALVDKGYVGLDKLHPKCRIPKKSSKNHKLTSEEKRSNAELSRRRIGIEHVNRYLKRFRILSGRYRNKRRKFALRATLIAGIYNSQH